MSSTAFAGWYPQPDGSQRYWDGGAWTAHQTPGPVVPAVAPVPPAYGVVAKNPALMLLASFFVPGLGTLINGETGKGIGILVGYFISFVLAFVLIGLPFMLGFWIWGMVDAYSGAQKWNARHGVIS